MSKHTPGPWVTCNTANVFTKLGAPNAEGTNAPSNDGWMIADCDMGSLSLAEVRANTLLIAAAPELLDALKCVIGWSQSPNRYIPDTCIGQVRKAVTKATGE